MYGRARDLSDELQIQNTLKNAGRMWSEKMHIIGRILHWIR